MIHFVVRPNPKTVEPFISVSQMSISVKAEEGLEKTSLVQLAFDVAGVVPVDI
jgi:hypothetical protein